jgi:ribosome-associated GTPase EngA
MEIERATGREEVLLSLADTGGWGGGEVQGEAKLTADVAAAAAAAAESADLALVLVSPDTTTLSDGIVRWLRRRRTGPSLTLLSKVDSLPSFAPAGPASLSSWSLANAGKELDAWRRFQVDGRHEILPMSALHRIGLFDVVDKVREAAVARIEEAEAATGEAATSVVPGSIFSPPRVASGDLDAEPDDTVPRIAIIGQPNVGKSSFLNTVVGHRRALVAPIPGTTRDVVDEQTTVDGRNVTLVDTAGVRRSFLTQAASVDKTANIWSLRAASLSHVCIVLIDATEGLRKQDAFLIGHALENGASVVVGINKWDLLPDESQREWVDAMREELSFAPFLPIMTLSAETGEGVQRLMREAVRAFDERSRRLSTRSLNNMLMHMRARDATARRGSRQAHHGDNRHVRLSFASQAAGYPPTFVFRVNDPDRVHFSLTRRLENEIREIAPYTGSPVRIIMRKSEGKAAKRGLRRKRDVHHRG